MRESAAPARSAGLPTLALVVLAVYAFLGPKVTADMRDFLVPWLDHILEHGPVGAFAIPFSNYSPPYLYLLALVSPLSAFVPKIALIKALSIGATLLLALAGRRLLQSAGRDEQLEPMLRLLLLPSVAINAACFGQCDAIWSAACLMAIACAIDRRPVAMLVWFGIGVSFKAQAVFLGPFILLRLLQERTSPWLWGLPVLVFAAAMAPAAVAGWPIADLATIYLRQAAWNPEFISNAANPWSIVQLLAPAAGRDLLWLGHGAAAIAAVAYVTVYRRRDSDSTDLVALALLSACLMPFLLPKMHERFFFLADVLAFLFYFLRQDRRSLLIFFLVQGASVLALIGLILKFQLAPAAGSFMVFGAVLMLIQHLRAHQRVDPASHASADFSSWQKSAPA